MSLIVGEKGIIGPNGGTNGPNMKQGGSSIAARGFSNLGPNSQFMKALHSQSSLEVKMSEGIFKQIHGADGSASTRNVRVSESDLLNWVYKNNVFPNLNEADSKLTAGRIFRDIDDDNNGTLDFEEFYHYMELCQREQRLLRYVNKHHLTSLPPSIRVTNSKEFSLHTIETALCEKIQQLTSRDSDRYRQVLTLFRTQVQRSGSGSDNETLCMTSRDFNTFLSMLGMFATREQAQMLFNKYDANGDGVLTVHEFMTRAKASDYPGMHLESQFDFRRGRGKRMYSDTKNVNPKTPNPALYDMSTDNLCARIRERLEQTAKTGSAWSDQKARRKLFSVFEPSDPHRTGRVTVDHFRKALQLSIGVTMTSPHVRSLLTKYADQKNNIDYASLVMECYPAPMEEPITSLIGGGAQTSDPKSGRRWQAPSNRNAVHLTGSYWAPASSDNLPPLSRPGSKASGMGLEVRGMTPTSRRGGGMTPTSRGMTPKSRTASRTPSRGF